MSNPILDQVMGRSSRVNEDVPVPCAIMPRRSYRDRLERQRQRRDPEGNETDQKREDESMSADLRAVLGEAEEGDEEQVRAENDLIPKDAEEIDGTQHILTTRLNKIKNVVQEPSHPSGEKEKYLTPYAALTAPDATPEGMSPLDSSKVPGMVAPNKFSWSDLEKATPEAPMASPGGDTAVNAMDVLLGRVRGAGQPAANTAEMAAVGQVATEEAMLAAMGIQNPAIVAEAAAKAAAAMVVNPDPTGSSLMPDHKPADIQKVCETARKWI